MSRTDWAPNIIRGGHQTRHRLRTRWERAFPRRLDDGAISPAGVPTNANATVECASKLHDRRRDLAAARSAAAVAIDTMLGADCLHRMGGAGVVMVEHQNGRLSPNDPIAQLIRGTTVASIGDPDTRERLAVLTRRLAWRLLRPRRPSLSVILATSRPEQALHAAEQLGRQRNVSFQLVVGLHGPEWAKADLALFSSVANDVVVRQMTSAATLGQVLGELTNVADGTTLTKWDDDDYYGPHHLEDLQSALLYSGADLVGRGADFVFLESTNTTIRRPGRAEAFDRLIAGGTLLMARDRLAEVGGWGTLSRHVDLDLIDRVHRHGGWSYRTHPFGYLLTRRAGGGHTWTAPDTYFESVAVDSRPGLALEYAGIER